MALSSSSSALAPHAPAASNPVATRSRSLESSAAANPAGDGPGGRRDGDVGVAAFTVISPCEMYQLHFPGLEFEVG